MSSTQVETTSGGRLGESFRGPMLIQEVELFPARDGRLSRLQVNWSSIEYGELTVSQ